MWNELSGVWRLFGFENEMSYFEGYVDVFEPPHSFLSNSWLLVENMEHMKYNLSFLKKYYQILKILEWSVQKRGYTQQIWQGHNFLSGIANVSSQESY